MINEPLVRTGIETLKRAGIGSDRLTFYMLVEEDFYRFGTLRSLGVHLL